MRVLALNAGSSSLKAAVRERAHGPVALRAQVERVASHWREAADSLGSAIDATGPVDAVVHRVVHGGPDHIVASTVDDALLADLRVLVPLAPLHLPAALETIDWARRRWRVPHVACFDTAFHASLPEWAATLPLSVRLRADGFRRYGFHGLSVQSVIVQRPDLGDAVVAHLGSGCSVTAVDDSGRSRYTTMSYAPGSGMVSSTRTGDLDPDIVLRMWESGRFTPEEARRELNRVSGIAGVSGGRSDLRDLLGAGDEAAVLAVEMFVHSAAMAIGAAATALDDWRSLVFTGGVGEHQAPVRDRVCDLLRLDGVSVHVVPADEERVMDADARRLLAI